MDQEGTSSATCRSSARVVSASAIAAGTASTRCWAGVEDSSHITACAPGQAPRPVNTGVAEQEGLQVLALGAQVSTRRARQLRRVGVGTEG